MHKTNREDKRFRVWRYIVRDESCSYAESEQRDMIHFLEGVSPNVVDEDTGIPLKQEDMLVKLYARANSDEVKNPQILR